MTQMLTLPPALDMRAAVQLKADLHERQGAPLDLDGAHVERVGGLCLQILIAAATAWRAANLQLRVVNPSQAFQDDLRRMGAALLMGVASPC